MKQHKEMHPNREHIHLPESLGALIADKVVASMGSWRFVIIQTVIVAAWIISNIWLLAHPYDPYPLILLNLIFSTQAAYASPLIMMSQNRQSEKDRVRDNTEATEVEEMRQILILLKQVILEIQQVTVELCQDQKLLKQVNERQLAILENQVQERAELMERLQQMQEYLQSTQMHWAGKMILTLHEVTEGLKPKGRTKKNDTKSNRIVTGTTSPHLTAVRVVPTDTTSTADDGDGATGRDGGTD